VFIVFAGEDNYPNGGTGDFVGWYYTYEEALAKVKELPGNHYYDWIEIACLGWEVSERAMVSLNIFWVSSLFNAAKWQVPDMWEKWRHGPPPGSVNQHLGFLLNCKHTGKRFFLSSRKHPTGYCELPIDR
jgi:hypothetical protein